MRRLTELHHRVVDLDDRLPHDNNYPLLNWNLTVYSLYVKAREEVTYSDEGPVMVNSIARKQHETIY